PGDAALRIAPAQLPHQHTRPHVERVPVLQQVGLLGPEVVAARGGELQRQPVGQVHHVLVGDLAPGHRRGQPVVDAGRVRAGGAQPPVRGGAPGGEAAVAERAQGLAQPLTIGVEALVREDPRGHRRPTGTRPTTDSSDRSCTTTSAPARSIASVCDLDRSTALTRPNPPRRPASTPGSASSSTATSAAGSPTRLAASRNSAGSGLPGKPSWAASL